MEKVSTLYYFEAPDQLFQLVCEIIAAACVEAGVCMCVVDLPPSMEVSKLDSPSLSQTHAHLRLLWGVPWGGGGSCFPACHVVMQVPTMEKGGREKCRVYDRRERGAG